MVGQYSLMPGQCTGLPRSGYATVGSHQYIESASMVLTRNSMGSREIWDKYHSCCIENRNFNVILVVFIPNFTVTHVITSTNPTNKFMCFHTLAFYFDVRQAVSQCNQYITFGSRFLDKIWCTDLIGWNSVEQFYDNTCLTWQTVVP